MSENQDNNGLHLPSILIVDDVPKNLQVLVNILKEKDYKVAVASSGQQALSMIDSFHPDLILLDTSMPVMNGHEVLEQLSRDPDLRSIPVIMVTAACEVDDVATASSYGIVDYIAKPFDFAQLKEKIENILEGRKTASGV